MHNIEAHLQNIYQEGWQGIIYMWHFELCALHWAVGGINVTIKVLLNTLIARFDET